MKKKVKRYLPLLIILVLGFLVRILLSREGLVEMIGDIRPFSEWGDKFWLLGPRNFYFSDDWFYTFPTYPPLSSLMYAGINWLYRHFYILVEIRNVIPVIPPSFLISFSEIVPKDPFMYWYGYYLLLKLPAIIADLAISLLIYKIIIDVTRDRKKALIGLIVYLFNPITIFLSGVWGQTESLVAFFGFLAFVLAFYKKTALSIPAFLISLYIKPIWIVLVPLYLFLLYLYRPKFSQLFLGIVLALTIVVISTIPFSGKEIIGFTKSIVVGNMLPTVKGTARASVSAFNFHTIFLKIDRSFDSDRTLGFPAYNLGLFAYLLINMFTFLNLWRTKLTLLGVIAGIFVVGLGSISSIKTNPC